MWLYASELIKKVNFLNFPLKICTEDCYYGRPSVYRKKKEGDMRLGAFLLQKKIGVRDFAKEAGVSYETVRDILYERGYISAALAKKIYKYTDEQVRIEDMILHRAGWERCPCCSQTISDESKINEKVLKVACEYKKQLETESQSCI